MRHNKKINHLGRQAGSPQGADGESGEFAAHAQEDQHDSAEAKALRMYVEPLITKSKEDTTHSRRTVFSYLKDKEATAELFRTIAPKIADRPGGYCRILKTGFRLGDAAEMCFIELVDFDAAYTSDAAPKAAAAPKTRRSRSGAKKAAAPAAEAVAARCCPDTAAEAAPAKKAAAKKPAARQEARSCKKPAAKKADEAAAE